MLNTENPDIDYDLCVPFSDQIRIEYSVRGKTLPLTKGGIIFRGWQLSEAN